jgi:hypothetical protein
MLRLSRNRDVSQRPRRALIGPRPRRWTARPGIRVATVRCLIRTKRAVGGSDTDEQGGRAGQMCKPLLRDEWTAGPSGI